MGQITHARERIVTITAEKLGPRPAPPEKLDHDEVMRSIRNGDTVVKPTQLRQALDNYVNRTPVDEITSSGGKYDYRTGKTSSKTYYLTQTVRSTLSQCLADVVAPPSYAADLQVWKKDQKEWERRRDLIKGEAVAVEDAIVLGDNAAALAALQAFVNFTA